MEHERSDARGRAFAILALLRDEGRWQASDLAERLGTSPRTIRRDVRRLRELGCDIEAATGADGGYRLLRGPSALAERAWMASSPLERELKLAEGRPQPRPCTGTAIVHVSPERARRYAWPETEIEPIATNACRITFGGWSWGATVAYFALFDAPFELEGPGELLAAAREVAARVHRAAEAPGSG